MYSGFPGLSLNRNLERGQVAIGGFRSDPYLDKGYSGVQLSPTQGGIPTNKMVIGQYTYNSPIRGQGSQNYFVVADAPQQQAAPAPAPAAAPAPQQQLQIAQMSKEAEEYRAQAEKTIGEAQAKIAELSNVELQRQKAAELQNRLAIQASASQSRGMMAPSLKIASATPQTAGTQAFKRRRDQATMAPIQSTAGINVPTGSVLNI